MKKNSPYKVAGDLKGAKLGISQEDFSYYTLREMVPARPEDFFGTVTVLNSDVSKIYAVAFGTMDVVQAGNGSLWKMKITDPGPAKLVKPISCAGDYYDTPIFVSKKLPEDVISLFKKQFGYIFVHPKEAMNDPEYAEYKPLLQKYLPIIQKYKFRMISVTRDNYKSIMDVYNTAKKNGWDKDYELWKKITKTKAE